MPSAPVTCKSNVGIIFMQKVQENQTDTVKWSRRVIFVA